MFDFSATNYCKNFFYLLKLTFSFYKNKETYDIDFVQIKIFKTIVQIYPGKGQKKTQNLVAVIYFQNMSQAVDKIKIPSLQVLKKK